MKTKEVEEILGIDRETIRFYIREGLISPPKRDGMNYRVYSEDDLRQLKRIMILRQLEISISDIRAVFDGTVSLRTLLTKSEKQIRQKMIIAQDAVNICSELKNSGEAGNSFDPEPYFRNYREIFGEE